MIRDRIGRPGQRFFVCDFETAGLDTATVDIVEVGLVICDEHFNVIDTFQSLIAPQAQAQGSWSPDALPAYKVHGILPSAIADAPDILAVGLRIRKLAADHTRNGNKPVLVSDNIQFEWQLMARLVHILDCFHYCGWDTSLLLEATGVGDPKPVHRALADAGLAHAAIVKALDRTRMLR